MTVLDGALDGATGRPGPVALLGSGEFLAGMADLDRRLLGDRVKRVVHLPTAAGQESPRRLRYWRDLATGHFADRLGVEVETIGVLDRRSADDPRNVAMLDGAGLIYLSGGNPGYLAAALRGTRVLARIRELHTAGTALAGCSAGAAALTAIAPDVRSADGDSAGLSLIPDLAVLPHYDGNPRWQRSLSRRFTAAIPAGMTTIGIDEHTAIVTDDLATFEVYGRGSAVRLPDTVFRSGESFRL